MIIDRILDRYDAEMDARLFPNNHKPYDPHDFFVKILGYRESNPLWADEITLAMDYGTEEDVQNILCEYIDANECPYGAIKTESAYPNQRTEKEHKMIKIEYCIGLDEKGEVLETGYTTNSELMTIEDGKSMIWFTDSKDNIDDHDVILCGWTIFASQIRRIGGKRVRYNV